MAKSKRRVGEFIIGGTNNVFVVADWVPDPDQIEADLLRLTDRLSDMDEPLEGAKEAFIYSTSQNFYHERDPDHIKWKALEIDYEEWKTKHGHGGEKILILESDLYEAATSEEAWEIVGNDIVFQVDALPKTADGVNYGAAHQSGTKGAGPGIGQGKNLPQRMFVGADTKTIEEVEDIFKEWIDGLIEEYWDEPDEEGPPSLGTGTNIHGEFPVVGYTKTGQPLLRTPGGIRFGRKLGR